MEIHAKSADRNLLLELSGEIDHHSARNAMRELEMAVDAALPKNLVLDMTGVTFMDSSGIALILKAQHGCSFWTAACWCAMSRNRQNGSWMPPGSDVW